MSGFWTWATNHYWLAFFLLLSAIKTVRVIVKAFFRIWWAPAPSEPARVPALPVEPQTRTGPTMIRATRIRPPEPPKRPEPPVKRRNMWDRILND